ncbi:acyltransferase family protein [Asaia astilbis]
METELRGDATLKTSTLPPPLPVDGLKRNNGVDCLRGIAILLVVIHHLALRFPLTETDLSRYLPQRLLRALTWDGPKGVTLFFVISGFLITTHMVQRWGNPARLDLYDFVSRRVARIMPCLIGLIVIISLLGALRVPSFVPLSAGQSLGGAAFSALFKHLNVYEARTGYLPAYWDVLWSLSVEKLFYLAFPLVCLTLGRYRGGLLTCALVLALAAPWCEWILRNSPEIWQEKAYGPGLCAIATGVVTALLFRSAVSANSQRSTAFAGWCGAGGLCAYLFWGSVVWSLFSWATPLFFNASIALTLWAFARDWGATATRSGTGWLRLWSQRSYELYLSHMSSSCLSSHSRTGCASPQKTDGFFTLWYSWPRSPWGVPSTTLSPVPATRCFSFA